MSHSEAPGAEPRSRLDPEPLPRRDFLGLAAIGTAGTALLFALFGILRLPKAAVLPAPSKKFRIAIPESLAPGTPVLPKGRSVAVFRDTAGVYAVSTVCTHLGCIVKTDAEGFHCPCHGSRFGRDGAVEKGPAPQGLRFLAVKRVSTETYIVDEGSEVPPSMRAEA